MAETDRKKVKTINGWKVNHPFKFGNFFYAFLILILVGVPLVYIFIPSVGVIDQSTKVILPYITGSDLLRGFFKGVFANPDEQLLFIFNAAGILTQARLILIIQTSLLLAMMGLSIAYFVFFLINIIKGYLRHARIIRVLTLFELLFSAGYAVTWLVVYIAVFINIKAMPNIFVWWPMVIFGGILVVLITISITYANVYKDVIFEADLEYHSDGEKEVVTHVTEVHNVTKVDYKPANTLPPNLTSIGGHAFAENQYLEIANIPIGISTLGGGAFANCLKLKVVSLPEDVKEIGYNCFFNCVSLERINYAGSKEQWRHIKRGSNWLAKAKTTQVVCVDGPIVVNPYH